MDTKDNKAIGQITIHTVVNTGKYNNGLQCFFHGYFRSVHILINVEAQMAGTCTDGNPGNYTNCHFTVHNQAADLH